MKKDADLLVIHASQLLTMDSSRADTADHEESDLGMIRNGAVAISGQEVLDVGESERILDSYSAEQVIDAAGKVVTPGLVDPHTHLIFAGSRHMEFGMRMKGATYHEILAAGGGIHSTVEETRSAPLDDLVNLALPRLASALSFGVTTVEIKSGYGLDVDTELKMLRAAKRLNEIQPVRIVPTYLGAHLVPLEYVGRREEYVDLVISEALPKVADEGLASARDIFLDVGAFDPDEAEAILGAARQAGLWTKIHAGQFTDQGGPQLIARMGGLSADHLESISDEGIEAMAQASVVAVLLPGAAFSLRDRFPDGRRIADAGVDVAVATDDNPGTSRTENLPLMAALAATRMGLSCVEAWLSVTANAAKALGLEREVGSLAPGMKADLVVFDISDFRSFLYHFGMNHASTVVLAGKVEPTECAA